MTNLTNVLSSKNMHERDRFITFEEEGHKYTILNDAQSKYTSVTTWCHTHFSKFNSDEILKNMMRGKNWNPSNKYWGLTREQIKTLWDKTRDDSALAGTNLHYEIECFMNNPDITFRYTHKDLLDHYRIKNNATNCQYSKVVTMEWTYFLAFVNDHPDLTPYRTEWSIYDEDVKLAGSIDMVYEKPDGTLEIYDWKRVANITTVNRWNKYATTKCICHMHDSNFWHYTLQLNTYKKILEAK